MTPIHEPLSGERSHAMGSLPAAQEETVDRLLRTFFHQEMPRPWPARRRTDVAPRPAPRSRWTVGSRYLALAASLLAIVLGLLIAPSILRQDEAVVPAGAQPRSLGFDATKQDGNGRNSKVVSPAIDSKPSDSPR
jgi:hypothetical protein